MGETREKCDNVARSNLAADGMSRVHVAFESSCKGRRSFTHRIACDRVLKMAR